MRRADRLFEIVQLLRGGRLRTAQNLADHFEVSVRTVYRDIDALVATGVPIDGERGVGYVLRPTLHLPPLTFTPAELEALALGARFVRAWADPALAGAVEEALVKIDAVLPSGSQGEVWRGDISAHAFHLPDAVRDRLKVLRPALRSRRKLRFGYADDQGAVTERTVRPLGLDAWGHAWTLTAWCELRQDFRTFRLDRMRDVAVLDAVFRPEPGRTLKDYLASLAHETKAAPSRKDIATMAPRNPAPPASGPRPLMPGVGPKSTAWLAEVGIETADELRAVGAVAAYVRLKHWNPRLVSLNALWGLHAALAGIPWTMVDPATKERLLADVRAATGEPETAP